MKQSAVEFLEKEIFRNYKFLLQKVDCTRLEESIKQAKEFEKQQIIDARVKKPLQSEWDEAEQYYNETFGKSTPWYDEDKVTERMNIIGQNGNDGEHY